MEGSETARNLQAANSVHALANARKLAFVENIAGEDIEEIADG